MSTTTTTPGTPGWLRARNDRVALGLLLEHGPLTRNRIGELSGLSKPTAAQMVARLESAGLISVVATTIGCPTWVALIGSGICILLLLRTFASVKPPLDDQFTLPEA